MSLSAFGPPVSTRAAVASLTGGFGVSVTGGGGTGGLRIPEPLTSTVVDPPGPDAVTRHVNRSVTAPGVGWCAKSAARLTTAPAAAPPDSYAYDRAPYHAPGVQCMGWPICQLNAGAARLTGASTGTVASAEVTTVDPPTLADARDGAGEPVAHALGAHDREHRSPGSSPATAAVRARCATTAPSRLR